MATKRAFKYLKLGPTDSTTTVKSPNGPASFSMFIKSYDVGDDTANLTITASFVANPAAEDLIPLGGVVAVEGETTLTEWWSTDDNRYPYFQFVYEVTPTGAATIKTDVYIGWY